METKTTGIVCVTGGAGYLGSWLIKELLKKGYVVHATLRDLGDESRTGLLKSFDGADERLRLFQADIYEPDSFEPAIEGCVCIFLIATPLLHNTSSSLYKNTTEASVSAVRKIMRACERSQSVKRVIYTGSVFSTSPWKEDGSGFEDSMDESCWTPLHLPYAYLDESEQDYMHSKTETERELLLYNTKKSETTRDIQVVSLVCGLVGGDTILPHVPSSMAVILSPLTLEKTAYRQLSLLQTLLGSVPLVHIHDVCAAHIFCMETTSNIHGRFLCVSECPTMHEFVTYYERKYPDAVVRNEIVGDKIGVPCGSTKLLDIGFKCKYNGEQILLNSVASAINLGTLPREILAFGSRTSQKV